MAVPQYTPATPRRKYNTPNAYRVVRGAAYITLTDHEGEPTGEAIVDAEDLDRVLTFGSWHRQDVKRRHDTLSYGIASVRSSSPHFKKRGQQEYLHHVVLGLVDREEIDHLNGNGLDNRKANLQPASRSDNRLNSAWHRRIERAEEVLRALVDKEPTYLNAYQDTVCVYCDGEGIGDEARHATDCPWLAACQLVRE